MSLRRFGLAFAAALLAESAAAHMIMNTPVPFNNASIDSAPLGAGAFPCKQNEQGWNTITQMNNMVAGVDQTLSFRGSAIHGGGSCQLAVTLDKVPTAKSTFKVIKSMEGSCPGFDNGPVTFPFHIPTNFPNGEATFAWTWFSRLSGAPEMYMNCAPITVTGGANDNTGFNALPDMFVANIPEVQCTTPQTNATKFPNPGTELKQDTHPELLSDPTGASCGTPTGSPAAPDSASPTASAPPVSTSASTAAPDTPAASETPSASVSSPSESTPAAATSSAAGVFAPGASPAAPTTETITTLLTVTATASTPDSTGSSSSSNGNSCSPDGAVICNGPTQFGLCNFGQVVWQDVAAGTTCSNGVISKRSPQLRIVNQRRSFRAGYLF